MTGEVVIVSATRTPIGTFLGSFSSMPSYKLGVVSVHATLEQANVAAGEVDELIFGQVLTGMQGQNPARQTALDAGLKSVSTAFLVNQVCASGLRSVAIAAQQILTGDATVVIAGGQESMSMAPHAACIRNFAKMGEIALEDTMIKDGLWDVFNNYHMGNTAENIAKEWKITREEQDKFAVASQNKAETAQKAGVFKQEIAPVTVKTRKGDVIVDNDEYIRHGATMEMIGKLKPAFIPNGTVTPGNSSGLNDGAASLLLMSSRRASQRGLTPLARIVSWATAGVDPKTMGIGPVPASKLAVKKAGWKMNDIDLIEANEAFAAQAIAVNRELELDTSKVNVNGGSIALGHPIGASGARILVTLIHEMNRRQHKKGLVTLCVGGGMGIAMTLELCK